VQAKLILAKDVRQVLTYVETGNVDAGLCTQAMQKASRRCVSAVADEGLHEAVIYPVAVLRDAKNDAAGRDFSIFSIPPPLGHLSRFGFLPSTARSEASSTRIGASGSVASLDSVKTPPLQRC